MNNEQAGSVEYPIGLYQDKESGQYIGALDPVQANAFVHVGFTLIKEAKTTEEALEMAKEENLPSSQTQTGGTTYEPDNKKGK